MGKYGKTIGKLQDHMRKLQENYGKTIGKYEKTIGKIGQTIGTLWENYRKTMGQLWTHMETYVFSTKQC